jgi:Fe-S-cluster containining protein
MEVELRQAVFEAARRSDVTQAVAAVYSALADAINLRRPICKTSGRCCRFEEFGHRLYVSTMELAKFVADRAASGEQSAGDRPAQPQPNRPHALPIFTKSAGGLTGLVGPGCPFQVDGLCQAHEIRPFGCRIFFCDETSTQWQHDMYEQLHGQLRRLHEDLNVPYHYVEWRFALRICL